MKDEVLSFVRARVAAGIDVNTRDEEGRTALMMAAESGHDYLVQELLTVEGVDLNVRTYHGSNTALMLAVQSGSEESVRYLLSATGIDVNARTIHGQTALMMAAREGEESIVQQLLYFPGIDTGIKDNYFCYTALMHAEAQRFMHIADILRPLTNVSFTSQEAGRALLTAACMAHINVLRSVLDMPSVNVNAKSDYGHGETALVMAVKKEHDEIVDMLLSAPGIDVNSRDYWGNNSLAIALQEDYDSIFQKLLSVPEIDINAESEDRKTVLILAAELGKTDVVEQLLSLPDINVNAVDSYNNSALIMAVGSGHYSIVKNLIAMRQVDANIKDSDGYTALMHAEAEGYNRIASLLKPLTNAEFSIEEQDKALKNAIYNDHDGIVKQFFGLPEKLEYIHLAVSSGKVGIVKLMLNKLKSSGIKLDNDFLNEVYKSANDKALKCFLYMGVISENSDMLKQDFPVALLNKIKNSLVNLSDLKVGENTTGLPNRLSLLEAKVCGVEFSEDITHSHTAMSAQRFRVVSSLMRAAVLTKLSDGFNDYIFIHSLMLNLLKRTGFSKLSFELKSLLLDFIVGNRFIISREDFFATRAELANNTVVLQADDNEHIAKKVAIENSNITANP